MHERRRYLFLSKLLHVDDLAKAYHDTIQHFYDLGARYVQLDDTTWGYLIQQFENEKNNPEKTAELAKTQILQQAATAMVGQANKAMQTILTLLR